MDLLLMRHASAVRGGPFADVDRPLLAEGELQAEWAGRALRRLAMHPVRIWTSPAARCRRTAEVVLSHLGSNSVDLVVQDSLAVGGGAACIAAMLEATMQQAEGSAEAETLLIVGHQPDLEELVTLLLNGEGSPAVALQPGGCVLLRLFSGRDRLRAQLHWLLTPAWFELVAGI